MLNLKVKTLANTVVNHQTLFYVIYSMLDIIQA
jgi:hypothetical protein